MSVATGEERPADSNCCCDLPHLTEAQIRVLEQIADRKSSKQVGVLLGNSPYTVDTHVKSMLGSTGANDRGELVRMVVRQQIIDMSGGSPRWTGKRCVQPKLPPG